jgi:hypothetical protein
LTFDEKEINCNRITFHNLNLSFQNLRLNESFAFLNCNISFMNCEFIRIESEKELLILSGENTNLITGNSKFNSLDLHSLITKNN